MSKTRSGFIAIVGRPNVGKSTLINAMVGHKVAIVSDKPQTTRRAIRGVITHPGEWQIVLIDLPGVQRPRDTLTERMQKRVERELKDADLVLFVVSGPDEVGGPGDRFIAQAIRGAKIPVVIAVNKLDRMNNQATVLALDEAAKFKLNAEIFPISALKHEGVAPLMDHLVSLLPESPFFFEEGRHSDMPESVQIAELVREQVLRKTRQEIPHAVEVQVDEIIVKDSHLHIRTHVLVESESQKGILIGAGGQMIKAIGVAARAEIERELDTHVHLDLSVRVKPKWRGDSTFLDRLGIN